MSTPWASASILDIVAGHRAGLAALLLVIAGSLAFQNAQRGPFLPDDEGSIAQNDGIRDLADLRRVLSPPAELSVTGRPLVSFTLALNFALGGLDVRGYHLANLCLHLLCGLLLLGVMRRTLQSPRVAGWCREQAAGLSFAVALLWLLHPLQTQAVNYVVHRSELLAALFLLLTLYSSLRASTSKRRAWSATWQVLGVVSCVAGMASKEIMAVSPPLVLLHDAIFVSGSLRQALRARFFFYLGLALSWVPLAMLLSHGPRTSSVGRHLGVSSREYAVAQLGVVARYLRLSLWPSPLVVDYGDWAARDPGSQWWAAALLLPLFATTLLALRRAPALGFVGAWFFVILAPTSSFMPIVTEVAAERRMYLPLASVVIALVIGGAALLRRCFGAFGAPSRSSRLAGAAATGLLALLLGGATLARNEDYRSLVVLWRDTVVKRPDNPRAWANLTRALDGRPAERLAMVRALVRDQASRAGYSQLGLLESREGRWIEAERSFQAAVRLSPRSPDAHGNVGSLKLRRGDVAAAAASFERAAVLAPHVASFHAELGRARLLLGKRDAALHALEQAMRLDPRQAASHSYLGQARWAQQRRDEAIFHYRRATALEPGNPDLHNQLGVALGETDDLAGAVTAFRAAASLRPADRRLRSNLELALARLAHPPSTRPRR